MTITLGKIENRPNREPYGFRKAYRWSRRPGAYRKDDEPSVRKEVVSYAIEWSAFEPVLAHSELSMDV
jgi:hypothetical protein